MKRLPNQPISASQSPTIIIDTREQQQLNFNALPSRRGTLQTGDYSILGAEELFAVERKSISDLVGCCTGDNRDRFERELHRLRGFTFKRLLIVGTEAQIRAGLYRSNINANSVLGSLRAWEVRYDIPIVFAATPAAAAEAVETWAKYFAREILKVASTLARSAPSQDPGESQGSQTGVVEVTRNLPVLT